MTARASGPTFLDDLVRDQQVIVCCGAGGVGKTTIAAALGLAAARAGRRALVLTIDPARRLAEAMGLDAAGCDEPTPVPPARLREAGIEGPGALDAWMLNPRAVVESGVRRLTGSPAQLERLLANRLYRHLLDMVIGLQEYTAGEALYVGASSDRYDLVVLDTPPSRNALAFLEAPRKLTVLLDEKVIGLFLPRRGRTRVWGGVVKLIQQVFSAAIGAAFFRELQEFLEASSHLFHEVHAHAAWVRDLLASPRAAFVLVSSAEPAALAEAAFFREQILSLGLPLRGGVLNRSWAFTRGLAHPRDLGVPAAAPEARRRGHAKLVGLAEAEWRLAVRDRGVLADWRATLPGGHALATPHVGEAVDSLAGLALLGANLVLPSVGAWEVDESPAA